MKSILDRLKYEFENTLSKGIGSLIGWLFLITIITVLIITFFVWFFSLAIDNSFIEQFWTFLLSTIGADSVHDRTWFYRFFYILIVFTGIFVTSILISILTQMIHERVEELKKGKSKVIEKNHTIILGWSPKIFTIIEELVKTNDDEKNRKSCIVVMGLKDNGVMEDEIRHTITELKKTKIVCRTGDSTVEADLEKLSIKKAKSVIIIASNSNTSDSEIIKTLLAIKGIFKEFPSGNLFKIEKTENKEKRNSSEKQRTKPNVIAEIHNKENSKLVDIISEKKALFINIDEFSARIIAQTSIQPGLPEVYVELLNFENDEIYTFKNIDDNISYKELLLKYNNASVIGFKKNIDEVSTQNDSKDKEKLINLNPERKYKISSNDKIILISQNDPSIKKGKPSLIETDIKESVINNKELPFKTEKKTEKKPEKILILGWNSKIWTIITELDSYVGGKSDLKIISNNIDSDKLDDKNLKKLKNFNITIDTHDYSDYKYLKDKFTNKDLNRLINKYLKNNHTNKDSNDKYINIDFKNKDFEKYLEDDDFKEYLKKKDFKSNIRDKNLESEDFYKYLKDKDFKKYRNIIILSDDRLNSQEADLKNIACLLYLREIEKKILVKENIKLYIVCELIYEKNQKLIEQDSNNDFVISSRLTSLFLAQISENTSRYHIFKQLFDDKGAEIYFRDARNFIEINHQYLYSDIVYIMSRYHNETVIGYRKYKDKDEKDGKQEASVHLNPNKDEDIIFDEKDQIIVLASD